MERTEDRINEFGDQIIKLSNQNNRQKVDSKQSNHKQSFREM
jgi:hypothetical protein